MQKEGNTLKGSLWFGENTKLSHCRANGVHNQGETEQEAGALSTKLPLIASRGQRCRQGLQEATKETGSGETGTRHDLRKEVSEKAQEHRQH